MPVMIPDGCVSVPRGGQRVHFTNVVDDEEENDDSNDDD